MNCQIACENMGAYLDGELAAPAREQLEVHLSACASCAAEADRLRAVLAGLDRERVRMEAHAPPQLWAAIERRMSDSIALRPIPLWLRVFRRPLAAAASVAVLIGAGVLFSVWVDRSVQTAQATVVDYGVLLDALPGNVDGAVERFLRHYQAEPMDADTVRKIAAPLRFNIPAELPGGFRLEQPYRLQFGHAPGFAARYRRDAPPSPATPGGSTAASGSRLNDSEPLFVFFHPPVDKTMLGVHRESHCDLAGRGGHRVEVGPWQLIHFTDLTTCHCLLSKLDRDEDLHAVLAAIAPDFLTRPAEH